MHLHVVRLLITASLLLPISAVALDFTFFGRKPESQPSRPVKIIAGVEPGVAVVFDMSSNDFTVLRPATAGEKSTRERAVYRFEWQSDGSARFFELANPDEVELMDRENADHTATPEGKKRETEIIQTYIAKGGVLRSCLPPEKPFRGTLSIYVVVAAEGTVERALVLPEGGVAECIMSQATQKSLSSGSGRLTAKASIRITP
jgi:hypothetical protein